MSQLLKTILYALSDQPLEEEIQAVEDAKEAVEAAEKHLTHQEFENLWNAIAGIEHASEVDSFVLGFRLGMQLTLEGLRPIN